MNRQHRIDDIEFPVRDLERSKRFYSAAVGWEFADYGGANTGIRMPGSVDEGMGGFSPAAEVRPGGLLVPLRSKQERRTSR